MALLGLRKLAGAIPIAAIALAAVAFMCPSAEAKRAPSGARSEMAPGLTPAQSLEGNFLSAYIAGASRDTTAAALFYREALKDDPRNTDLLDRAFVSLLADGDLTGAARAAERIVGRDASNGLAQLTLAVKAIKARQYGTARGFLVRSGGRGRAADLTATLLTAWSYAGSRDGRKALETVDQLRGERGFSAFRDYHGGLIAELIGNDGEAERRLKASYDAEKTTLRIVDAYGRLLARKGQTEAALEVYRAFEGVAPRHPMIKVATDGIKAGKQLTPLVGSPQDGAAEVLYGLGSAGSQQGDELASIIYLRLALQLSPDHALATVTLAEVFERLRRTEQAVEALRRVPASSPLKGTADIQVGLSLEQLGRGEEAVKVLEHLQAQRPDDNEVLVALGNLYRSRKQYPEAAAIYGKAIEKTREGDSSLWPLYYYRGTAYERAKEWPKAEADLKKALSLVPDTQPMGKSQVLNYLGYSWVDGGTNLDEAFRMLRQAVELNPRDGMIIDSLGWAYFRFGHWEDAVRELEKAAELKAGDPVINDHLGDAYWRVGRRLEAKFQWQHAKDSSPEPDDLKKIEEKLRVGLPDEPKPAEAQTGSTGTDTKSGG